MDFLEKLMNWIEGLNSDVVPIIGTPASGKTYFLASLTKWALANLHEPSTIFLEGRDYLYDLSTRLSAVAVDPSTRAVTGLISRNVWTDDLSNLRKVRLRLPYSGMNGPGADLVTIDGPGEVILDHPEILSRMVKNMKGLILLLDVIGDDPRRNCIDWETVNRNAIASVTNLANIVENELTPQTPIALVVTKWDRILTLEGFAEKETREASWKMMSARIKDLYLALVKQHRSEVFLHSSLGPYCSYEEAAQHNQTQFPFPLGIEPILGHCFSDGN